MSGRAIRRNFLWDQIDPHIRGLGDHYTNLYFLFLRLTDYCCPAYWGHLHRFPDFLSLRAHIIDCHDDVLEIGNEEFGKSYVLSLLDQIILYKSRPRQHHEVVNRLISEFDVPLIIMKKFFRI